MSAVETPSHKQPHVYVKHTHVYELNLALHDTNPYVAGTGRTTTACQNNTTEVGGVKDRQATEEAAELRNSANIAEYQLLIPECPSY